MAVLIPDRSRVTGLKCGQGVQPWLTPASVQIRSTRSAGPGRLDDFVLRQAGHGCTRDRSSEPVPRFDEFVLGPLIRLERKGQSVRCHARSMPLGRGTEVSPRKGSPARSRSTRRACHSNGRSCRHLPSWAPTDRAKVATVIGASAVLISGPTDHGVTRLRCRSVRRLVDAVDERHDQTDQSERLGEGEAQDHVCGRSGCTPLAGAQSLGRPCRRRCRCRCRGRLRRGRNRPTRWSR
jgi:hypothetical protein